MKQLRGVLPRVESITMTLQEGVRMHSTAHVATLLTLFPPRLLHLSCRVGSDSDWTVCWRRTADQPWFQTILSSPHSCFLLLFECPPHVEGAEARVLGANIGMFNREGELNSEQLVSLLRSRLSLDALTVLRGTHDQNGLTTMADHLFEQVKADRSLQLRHWR